MPRKNKPGVHLAVALMLILCIVPFALGESRRFGGRKEFLPYTRNLPHINKVELLRYSVSEDERTRDLTDTRVLKGVKAQQIASLWRRQTYTSSVSACHNPAYAVKFYSGGQLLAYASVCWSCNSISMITPNLSRTQSFRAGDRKGERLSELFRLAFVEDR